MQLPESIAEWKELIELLESSLVTLKDSESDIRAERSKLSLACAMQDDFALKRAEQLEMSGCRLALEIRTAEEALEQAKAGLAKAEEEAVAAAEAERQQQVKLARRKQYGLAESVDKALVALIGAVSAWLDVGDELVGLGENRSEGKQHGQLVRAAWFHVGESGLNRQPLKNRWFDVLFGNDRPSPASWRSLADQQIGAD